MELHEEDVITYEGKDELLTYRLSMPSTFRVQELKDAIARNFENFDGVSSSCRMLSHSSPGWRSGEITVTIEVKVEFKEIDSDLQKQPDSLEELRRLDA